jgi:hypothetical protein
MIHEYVTGNDHRYNPDDVIVIDPDDVVSPEGPSTPEAGAEAPAWDDASHWRNAVPPLEPDAIERDVAEPDVAEPDVSAAVEYVPEAEADPEIEAEAEIGAEAKTEAQAEAVAPSDISCPNRDNWHEVVASFIDDPRGSVQAAAALAETEITAYVTALNQREEALRRSWQAEADPSTEDLRLALRDYREFCRQLATPL